MARYVNEVELMESFAKHVKPLYTKPPDEFQKIMAGGLQQKKDYIYSNNFGLPDAFIDYWIAYFKYLCYYSLMVYPHYHQMSMGQQGNGDPAAFAMLLKNVPPDFNDACLSLVPYGVYISSYYQVIRIATDSGKIDTIDQANKARMLDAKALRNMPPATAEYYFAKKIKLSAPQLEVAKLDDMLADFTRHFPASHFLPELRHVVSKKKMFLAGCKAIDLDILDSAGNKMKLSDLEGQVVYLDFWASWCAPCKKEMPYAHDIAEHYKNKPVAFVYVSLDDREDAWAKAAAMLHVSGYSTRARGGWESDAAQQYDVQSLPSYFLIDKHGRFATDKAPRPDEAEKLIEAIDTLLQ